MKKRPTAEGFDFNSDAARAFGFSGSIPKFAGGGRVRRADGGPASDDSFGSKPGWKIARDALNAPMPHGDPDAPINHPRSGLDIVRGALPDALPPGDKPGWQIIRDAASPPTHLNAPQHIAPNLSASAGPAIHPGDVSYHASKVSRETAPPDIVRHAIAAHKSQAGSNEDARIEAMIKASAQRGGAKYESPQDYASSHGPSGPVEAHDATSPHDSVPTSEFHTEDELTAAQGGWIKGAVSHPGRMKRAAARAGESTHQYEVDHQHSPDGLGQAARLGLRLSAMSKKGKRHE